MIGAVLLCADRKKLLLAYFTIFGFWLAPLAAAGDVESVNTRFE